MSSSQRGPGHYLTPRGGSHIKQVVEAIARTASTCSTTANGTKNPGMNMNGNVPIIRLGTSAWIRLKGPGAVNKARITTFVSERSPSTFQMSASFIPNRPRVDPCEGQHFGAETVDPKLVQEQFDDDAEALRTQNDPERKSQRDASPSRRSQSQDAEDKKEQDGDKDKGDPRGAHGRVSDHAEISQ